MTGKGWLSNGCRRRGVHGDCGPPRMQGSKQEGVDVEDGGWQATKAA
jgi:hypothetical protein